MPSRCSAAIRRKLKSGKSMATKTSGRCSRATAVRRLNMAKERGSTRIASVRPVTESPWKSPTRRAPAAANRWPPKPKTSAAGSRWKISETRAPAYRSPDGSPHEIMMRIVRDRSERLLKEHQVDRRIEGDAPQRPIENLATVAAHRCLERHVDAVDLAVVGERLLRLRRTSVGTRRRVRLPDDAIVAVDIEANRLETLAADLDHFQHDAVGPFFRKLTHGQPSFGGGDQQRERIAADGGREVVPHRRRRGGHTRRILHPRGAAVIRLDALLPRKRRVDAELVGIHHVRLCRNDRGAPRGHDRHVRIHDDGTDRFERVEPTLRLNDAQNQIVRTVWGVRSVRDVLIL